MKGICFTALWAAFEAAASGQAPPAGELSDAVRPLSYQVDLVVDPAKERFSGESVIDVDVREAAKTLYLHGQKLKVARVEAVPEGETAIAATYTQQLTTGVAELSFERPLPPGRYKLRFAYDAEFQLGTEGLYRVKVGDDWYAWTQLQPFDARRAFPSFDEPRHKVPFTISITAPAGAKAYANAPLVRSTAAADGMVRHQFAPSKPIPTYLVAFAVGPFDEAQATVAPNSARRNPLALRHMATKGQSLRLAYGLRESPKILAMLEEYFALPYPYEKLDQLASPIMGGAMENPGLVIYDDTLLLLDADAPLSQQRGFGVVVAHELAHQWFGDFVTPRWWDDIWLNESFAEWMGNKIAAKWRPDIGAGPAQLRETLDAMAEDSLAVGRPIHQPIARNEDIKSAFDAITYKKGGQVLEMVETYLGPEKFRDGVQRHLRRFPHGTATSSDFFQSIGTAAGDERIVRAFQTFVNQPGVPLIEVRSAGNNKYTLRQQRYRPIGVTPSEEPTWLIPVCARTASNRACVLLEGREGSLSVAGAGWILPNAGASGYYRFDLDDEGWKRLIAAAPSVSSEEAMIIADSAWASFAAGRVLLTTALDAMQALAGSNERLSATLIPRHLADLSNTLMTPEDRKAYRRVMAKTFVPRLQALGLDLSRGAYESEDAERSQLRQQLTYYVAIEGQEPQVRRKLTDAAQASFENPDALDPGFRPIAFAVAAQDIGPPFMDELLDAMTASDDPLFRRHAAQGLGLVNTPALASRAIAATNHEKLHSLDKVIILFALLSKPETRDLAFEHIARNFNAIERLFAGFGNAILTIGDGYCTEADARKVDALLRPKLEQLGGGDLDLDRSLAGIRQCAALKQAKGAEISSALSGS